MARAVMAIARRGCGSLPVVLLAALILLTNHLGAAALEVSDLPRHPEDVCGSPQVTSTLIGCKLTGATQKCCQKLDDVFYNTTSPAAGCLCYPQVLYKVIGKASQQNFDVLHLFKNCSQDYDAKTDWAMRPDTTCPDIPLNASALDLVIKEGQSVLLESADGKPMWSWRYLLQGGEVMAYPEVKHELLSIKIVGLSCIQLLLVILISLAPVFLIMHKLVLMQFSNVYRELSAMQQVVTCQHAVYALIFSLQFVPQTIIAVRFLFRAWTGDYMASLELSLLVGVFILSRAALYLVEACVRSVHTSWLLLVHHELFFTIILMGVWTENTALLSIGVVLDLFACHEAPLYIVLVAYRLNLNITLSKVMLYVSCIWYSITRVFQTVVLVYMIVCWAGDRNVRLTPGFIITSLLCAAFTIIQAYTLVIYKAMGHKILSRARRVRQENVITEKPCGLTYSGKWPSSGSSSSDVGRSPSGDVSVLVDSPSMGDGKLHVSDSAKDVCCTAAAYNIKGKGSSYSKQDDAV